MSDSVPKKEKERTEEPDPYAELYARVEKGEKLYVEWTKRIDTFTSARQMILLTPATCPHANCGFDVLRANKDAFGDAMYADLDVEQKTVAKAALRRHIHTQHRLGEPFAVLTEKQLKPLGLWEKKPLKIG